jgi:TrmH family RNA methyltransferase
MPNDLDALRVVLVATRNPLNIGAAARAMSNFGAHRLRLVRPYELAFREARSAVGAAQLLAKAEVFETVADAVADCRLVVGTTAGARRQLRHGLRPLPQGGTLIRKRLAAGPVALLFGSEKVGLSNSDLSHCDWLLRIPTTDEHPSMNLGQAVAVCLYELARATKSAAIRKENAAPTSAALERIAQLLFDVLRASGYVQSRLAAITEVNLRRMIRRLQLDAADAEVWQGILRQIAWKLGRNQ